MEKYINRISKAAAVLALAGFLIAVPSFGDESAKQEIKEAGRDTKKAAVHTGKAVKKGSKKAVNKTAEVTAKGAEKVEQKTKP